MKFDEFVDRTETCDSKWNKDIIFGYLKNYLDGEITDDFIPMWIADTDFKTAPNVIKGIEERLHKGVLGYCRGGKDYYKSLEYWQKTRFGIEITPSEIVTLPTVVAGINIAIREFTEIGEGVIIQTPVYDPFNSIIAKADRRVDNNPLVLKNGKYSINFEELEKIALKDDVKMMIFCSPHNPVGRVWSEEELDKVVKICSENDIILVSDEIHSDIVYSGNKHKSMLNYANKDNKIIYLSSPGKSFNLPGLKIAYSVIKNEEMKKRFEEMQDKMSLDVYNTFGIEGLTQAYTEDGAKWLEEEISYLEGNRDFIFEFFKENLPKAKVSMIEGTFLSWIDMSKYVKTDEELTNAILVKSGVICVPGPWFGKGGEMHIRLNFGCTRKVLEQALNAIKRTFTS